MTVVGEMVFYLVGHLQVNGLYYHRLFETYWCDENGLNVL